MSRLGFQIHEDSVDAIEEISKMPGLKLEGMFTHFAKADETDKAYTDVQIGKYNYSVMNLKSEVSHFRFTTAQIVPVSLILRKRTWIWYVPEYPFMDCILPRR